MGSRLQKAKEAKAEEEEEDSLYATGDFEFDVTHACPWRARSLPTPEHATARCSHSAAGCHGHCTAGRLPNPNPTPTRLPLPLPLTQAVTVTALLGAAIAFQFFVLANL